MSQPRCWFNSQSARNIYLWSRLGHCLVRLSGYICSSLLVDGILFPIPGVRIADCPPLVTPLSWKFAADPPKPTAKTGKQPRIAVQKLLRICEMLKSGANY
jgi:hypothetical protein